MARTVGASCDFCGARPARWGYACDAFEVRFDGRTSRGRVTSALTQSGDWIACDACRVLVDGRDAAGLLARCTGGAASAGEVALVRALHESFFAHARGPARPARARRATRDRVAVAVRSGRPSQGSGRSAGPT